MKGLHLSKHNLRTLLAGIGLILLTNAVVLAGVAYNRSGQPESSVTLTERELALPFYYGALYNASSENSGIDLQFRYRSKGSALIGFNYLRQEGNWLTLEKLAELGFDVSTPIDTHDEWSDFKRQKEKEVILVLEYNGSAYEAALKAAQQEVAELEAKAPLTTREEQNKLTQAKTNLEQEQTSASRLFLIDAGLSQEALRQQYPDTSKYLLLKGLAGVYIIANEDRSRTYSGYIRALSIPSVNIPHDFHHVLAPALAEGYPGSQTQAPRYEVVLNVGKRLEPWIVAVKGI